MGKHLEGSREGMAWRHSYKLKGPLHYRPYTALNASNRIHRCQVAVYVHSGLGGNSDLGYPELQPNVLTTTPCLLLHT